MNTQLPQAFLERMEEMLKEGISGFSGKLSGAPSVRTPDKYQKDKRGKVSGNLPLSPYSYSMGWENGFFYGSEDRPSRHPYYQAGLYYLQEPSAMTPASRLPVSPGTRFWICAPLRAGRLLSSAAALKGRGLLVANDISSSRAKALMRNLELWGIENSLVTTETPRTPGSGLS